MAKTVPNPKIGDLVYVAYQPLKPAKIIALKENRCVLVQYLDGSTETRSVLGLRDFRALVDEHQRKYKKFSALIPTLEKL